MKFFEKSILSVFLGIGLAASIFAADTSREKTPEEIRLQNQYVEYRLSQGEIYKINVKMNNGVTTIQFPSKISEIAGKNISIDGKGTDFQIAAQPGSYYFNVSALTAGATGTLTVTYNRQLYILYLVQSDKEAYASVVFSKNSRAGNYTNNIVTQTPKVTPARLVSLIDIAKKYEILKETYPDTLAGVEQAMFQNRYRCGKYDIWLDEAYRFDEEDTIIFKLRLINRTAEELKYDKHSFSAHAGDNIYFMSVSDASGIMPPKSQTYAWFGITSTSRGGRNNLKADNDWLIAVTTKDMHLENIQSVQNTVKENERIAAEEKELRLQREKEAEEKLIRAQNIMSELDTQRLELAKAKAEIEQSFAELKSKLDIEKSETARLLREAREKNEAADKKLEAAELHAENAERNVIAPHIEAVAALKTMQRQTREHIEHIQDRTEEAIRKMKAQTTAEED